MSDETMTEVDRIKLQCSAALAGYDPGIQGAVLADLVAMHLAGHFADTDAETNRLRATLLALFVTTVRELIPVNEAQAAIARKRESHH